MSSPPPRQRGTHPLDTIPFFRRWPCSPWRDVIYTGIWSSMVGVALAAVQSLFPQRVGFGDILVGTVATSNLVGYLIHGGLVGLDVLLRGWPNRQTGPTRTVYYIVVVAALVVSGIAIANALFQGKNPLHYLTRANYLVPLVPFAVASAALMFVIDRAGQRRASEALAAMRQREEIAAAAQLLAEARLRALQAQIEPHFLYNTLAGVLSLIDTQPARARHMLERFIDFLRASLHASRADEAKVGTELDLAAAYLDILKVRTGERLTYRIEATPAARAVAIAPMLIQPLVENAVMHGLEAKVDGGLIVLRAQVDDGMLCVDVIDDGVGIGNAPPRSGGGVGLANIKARIRSVHGAGAQLQLLDNPGGGALVRLLLPLLTPPMVPPSTITTNPPH